MYLTPLSAKGAVRAAERELCRGRRQHVPLRLLAGVPPMGASASGLTQGLARRSKVRSISDTVPPVLRLSRHIHVTKFVLYSLQQSNEEQQTVRVHQRRPSHHQGVRQVS